MIASDSSKPAVAQPTANATVHEWVAAFAAALAAGDADGAAALFLADGYWRDLVSFTWTLKTVKGRAQIRAMLDATLDNVTPNSWSVTEIVGEQDGVVTAWLAYETAAMRGVALIRLRDGLCWTLLTAAKELKGHEETIASNRPRGAPVELSSGPNWSARRIEQSATLGTEIDPYVLIVGGGQGGLALAARLKQLRVPTLVVDKHARSGDQWRSRYESLCLHDPVWYDHLPYMPFPDSWPIYTPKDKIAQWLEAYETAMELDVWHSATCEKATFDEASGTWNVEVVRNGEPRQVRCTQLVIATGASGFPHVPTFPGQDRYQGKIVHSSAHPGGRAWRGKRAVVIGSNNSAHDICADLFLHGADVTMVQRSSTLVAKASTMMEFALRDLYSEEAVRAGIDTDKADLILGSFPVEVLTELQKGLFERIRAHDADFYRALEDAGFLLDFGEDGSGLLVKYLRRGGGYYIDVGASAMIADGRIKLRSGVGVERFTEDAVVLTDGSILPADLVIMATGYGTMSDWAAKLVSPEVAEKIGPCWGIGSGTTKDPGPWEGELRNMWKPTAQHGLWFHGGNLHYSRHYSRYLALQLKARREGIATPVYA